MKVYLLLIGGLLIALSGYSQNIGIGTNTPLYKLDVNGRMRVKSNPVNNIFSTSGIWYDDYRDGSDRIFAGMQDSLRWGLWGGGSGGAGWQFNFHARTGNIGMGRNSGGYRLELDHPDGLNTAFYRNGSYKGSIWSNDSLLVINSAYGSILCLPGSGCNTIPAKNLILNPPGAFFSFPGNVGINTNDPLARFHVDGSVMIGNGAPAAGYQLSVNGRVICTETRIQLKSGWPDYVFAKNYKLRTLRELEIFIRKNSHLPNMPSAADVEAQQGFDLGDIQKRLLEKVEELTLYVIALKKENEQLQKRMKALEKK